MIDIKWLLYRYDAIKQAKATAERLMECVKVRQAFDPNWWIHKQGGLPNSRTENAFFQGVNELDRMTEINGYLGNLNLILTSIDSAIKSLKKEFHDLITYRYIDDKDVYEVAHLLNLYTEKGELNMRKYYREHNIALEGMNISCMPLNFLFTQNDIEIIIGRLIVRKSVSNLSQNRVEKHLVSGNIVS